MANKNTLNRRRLAKLAKQDTSFAVQSTKGNYTITVSVKAHVRKSRKPKVAGRGPSGE